MAKTHTNDHTCGSRDRATGAVSGGHFLSYATLDGIMLGETDPEVFPMKMARIILFTSQMDAMSRYYGEVLGLPLVTKETGWREFAAGGVTIALHSGPSSPGKKGPKIVFYAEDVAGLRAELVARGASFGKVRQGEALHLCDGKDPDGNPVQLSNR